MTDRAILPGMHAVRVENYILNEAGEPVAEPALIKWARWFQTGERQLAVDEIGDVRVSTVFLGTDHQFGIGPPLLWESMSFGVPELRKILGRERLIREDMGIDFESLEQRRYSSRQDALRGHAQMVAQVHRLRVLLASATNGPAGADVPKDPPDQSTGGE